LIGEPWQIRTADTLIKRQGVGVLVQQPPDKLELDFPAYQIPLPEMSLREQIAADYDVQGLSASHHPMEVFRASISRDGIMTSFDIASLFSGTKVRVAGCVVCRQAPITAKGCVFITLEDEFGMVNVILRPQIYEKYRQVARMEPFIVVDGTLQKKDGVTNVVANHLSPLSNEHERQQFMYLSAAPRARNFT